MFNELVPADELEQDAASVATETQPDTPAPDAEAPSSPDAGTSGTPPDAQPPAGEAQPEQPTTPAAAPSAAPTPQGPPGEPSLPDTRQPFSFRADRTEVSVPGAYVDSQFVHIPREQWGRTIQPRLADRGQIQRALQERDQQIHHWRSQADPERNPAVQEARLLSQQLATALFDPSLTEDQVLDEVARIRGAMPVLQERARANAAQAQLQEYQGAAEQQAAVEAWHQSVPVLQSGLQEYVSSALSHPQIAAAGLDPQEIVATLWGDGGPDSLGEIFYDSDGRGSLVLSTAGGPVALRSERVDQLILTAARASLRQKSAAEQALAAERARSDAATRAAEVARQNAASLAPRAASPPVVGAGGGGAAVESGKPWLVKEAESKAARARGETQKAEVLWEEARALFDKHMGGW